MVEKLASKVFYTRSTNPEWLMPMFEQLGKKFDHPAVKVHTGERGNVNFIDPEYLSPFLDQINGVIVETNTAYDGSRNNTKDHMQLIVDHGWNRYPVDILDSESDEKIDIKNGHILNCDIIGSHTKRYDSCIVVSHFKAHPMGGFGGALKQLSIGFASADGKRNIHGYGSIERGIKNLENIKSDDQDAFLKAMADSAMCMHNFFAPNIAYITIMKNIATSCDCDANAPKAQMHDLGILASLDPVAIDAAALYILKLCNDEHKNDVIHVIEDHDGTKILDYAAELGFGTNEFKLIEIGETED